MTHMKLSGDTSCLQPPDVVKGFQPGVVKDFQPYRYSGLSTVLTSETGASSSGSRSPNLHQIRPRLGNLGSS